MITRVFHAFWDGPPMPYHFAGFLRRWEELHPGWSLTLWDTAGFELMFSSSRHIDYFRRPEYWSPKSNPWQWKSDLARYEILHALGGVWIDTDLEPLKSIEPIVEKAEENLFGGAFAAREDDTWVNNAFLGCSPGHRFMHDVLYLLDNRVRTLRHLRVNRSIGARYVTEIVRRHPEVLVLPRELIYPFRYDELHRRNDDFPMAFTKHHWNNRTNGNAQRAAVRRTRATQ